MSMRASARRRRGRTVLWTALVASLALGCGRRAEERPPRKEEATFGSSKATQGKRYQVALELVPEPPPMGELFEVRAVLRDRDGQPVETARVELNARMPHHDHGMETDPVAEPGVCDDEGACRHPGGIYETSGFKFHMGGAWTITVAVVEGPFGPDNTSFVYFMQ